MKEFRIERIQTIANAIMDMVIELDTSEGNERGSREHMTDAAIALLHVAGTLIADIASATDKSDPRRQETVEMIKKYMSEVLSV